MTDPTLSVIACREGFILSKLNDGKTIEVLLSETDILVLAQSAVEMKELIYQKYNRGGLRVTTTYPVADIGLTTDTLKTTVMMAMIATNGTRATFALPSDIAVALAEGLPEQIAKIATRQPLRQL